MSLGIEIVFHDRTVPPGPVPFERVDIALRPLALSQHRVDIAPVVCRQPDRRDTRIRRDMLAIARADDDRRDALSIEHSAAGDRSYIGAVAIGDATKCRQKCLEQVPAAEIIDDELVFRQRPVLERVLRFQLAEPRIRQKPTRH